MSALCCLLLCFRSCSEKLEEYISTFYKIRYILEELYVAVMWIISRLIIYIDQLNTALVALYSARPEFPSSGKRKENVNRWKSYFLQEKQPVCEVLAWLFFSVFVLCPLLTLSICTWFLKNQVGKIKFDELDF